jgi:hypothetical protein
MPRCRECTMPIRGGSASGLCSRCRRKCPVCDVLMCKADGWVCADCQPTLRMIAVAHARTPAPIERPVGHERRLALYEKLAARREPLSAA